MFYLVGLLVIIVILLIVILGAVSIIGEFLDTPEKKEARKEQRRREAERRKEEAARQRREAARQELEEIGRIASSIRGSVVAQWLTETFQQIASSDGQQLEDCCGVLFMALGYNTRSVGGPGDQGVDLLLNAENGKVAVQCKNYAKPVGNRAIQEVFAGARYHNASEAWVIAPRGFTKAATQLAERLDVWLVDQRGILRLIEQVRNAAASGSGRGIPDRNLHELLLEQYRKYVRLARRADEERTRGEGDPYVERQYEEARKAVCMNMGEVLDKLNALEKRNSTIPKVNEAERRDWQAEVQRAESKSVDGFVEGSQYSGKPVREG